MITTKFLPPYKDPQTRTPRQGPPDKEIETPWQISFMTILYLTSIDKKNVYFFLRIVIAILVMILTVG